MKNKPLLFLDVDGVLNCLAIEEPEGSTRLSSAGLYGSTTEVICPAGTKERLERLLEHYDPVWATAWLGTAHGYFRGHLCLSEFPWPYIQYAGYKITEIIKYAEGKPFVWVDDFAEYELDQLGWLNDIQRYWPDNAYYLAPDPQVGLTDEQVDRLIEFAKKL